MNEEWRGIRLSKVQAGLLLGFLIEHKRIVEKNPHKVALERIIETLKGEVSA